mmetsp:Transcript_5036/g.20655  ORF Transcript_5036/g.20655 Transcript_5036/m.20655 type:complete len:211 (-) Transcript_5036:1083-1715(-)
MAWSPSWNLRYRYATAAGRGEPPVLAAAAEAPASPPAAVASAPSSPPPVVVVAAPPAEAPGEEEPSAAAARAFASANGLGSSSLRRGTSVRRICCEKFWFIIVASIESLSGELISRFLGSLRAGSSSSNVPGGTSWGGSCDVSDTVRKSNAAVSRLSKTSAPSTFWTTTSHGYTERGDAIRSEKMASVPYTVPTPSSANFSIAGSSVVVT